MILVTACLVRREFIQMEGSSRLIRGVLETLDSALSEVLDSLLDELQLYSALALGSAVKASEI